MGGLELAPAFDYRLVVDQPDTAIGLPEIEQRPLGCFKPDQRELAWHDDPVKMCPLTLSDLGCPRRQDPHAQNRPGGNRGVAENCPRSTGPHAKPQESEPAIGSWTYPVSD